MLSTIRIRLCSTESWNHLGQCISCCCSGPFSNCCSTFIRHDSSLEFQGIVKNFFEIIENFCSLITLAEHILQSLRNRMVKTVFENSKFLMFKIGPKTFCSYVLPRGQKFSDRFTLKTSNFQNPF